jgi:hypothetical protein
MHFSSGQVLLEPDLKRFHSLTEGFLCVLRGGEPRAKGSSRICPA